MRREHFPNLVRSLRLCCLVTFLSFGTAATAGEPSKADQELVARVAAKFFETAPPVQGWAWPPVVGIADVDEVNAFASTQALKPGQRPVTKIYEGLEKDPPVVWIDVPYSAPVPAIAKNGNDEKAQPAEADNKGRTQPLIILYQGFLDTIVKGREAHLAETFGHELSHVLLKHAENYGVQGAPLLAYTMTRQQEADADMLGMKLALQADYPYDELIRAVKAWREYTRQFVEVGSTFEALGQSHPGWTDRASLIDSRKKELWSSISAFENGVTFLLSENYNLADRCFSQVIKEMPGCYEAWANRGYSRLMRYCDALEPDDLKEMGLSQIVVGGFYRRAGSLEERGVNADLWFDAVGDFREALRLKESLILPKANLALAYLVHPNRKEVGKAAELYEQVIEALKEGNPDEEISPLNEAALLVNAAVTELANGDSKTAHQFFDRAQKLYVAALKSPPAGPVKSAILYSQASQLAASAEVQQRKQAVQDFEEYLETTSPSVAWWMLAYERYRELAKSENLEVKTPEQLERPQTTRFRPVTSIVVKDGKELILNDPVTQVTELLGEGKKIPVVPRTNIHRRKYDEFGLELLCTDHVIAVRLRKASAPPLVLHTSGPGSKPVEIRVGMPLAELKRLLAGDESGWEKRYGAQYSVTYMYYYRLGFGVDVDEDGNIAEIILARIPYRAQVK